jgi:hypothetical protein
MQAPTGLPVVNSTGGFGSQRGSQNMQSARHAAERPWTARASLTPRGQVTNRNGRAIQTYGSAGWVRSLISLLHAHWQLTLFLIICSDPGLGPTSPCRGTHESIASSWFHNAQTPGCQAARQTLRKLRIAEAECRASARVGTLAKDP